jgi:uncharacterized membrane protein YccC
MKSALDSLKQNFTLDSNYLRYAIRLALSCTLTVALYELLHLKNGYWAAFSVIACVWPTMGQSLQRSRHRFLGTLIGVSLGVLIAHSFGSNLIYIDVLLPVFIFLTFYLRAYSYVFYVLFTTVVAVLFICLMVPGDWQVGIIRLEMTLVGILIALIATYAILPSRASNILTQQLDTAKQSIQQFYIAICQSFLNGPDPTSPRQDHVPQLHGVNSDLAAIQLQTFQNLQLALATVKEHHMEYWRAHYQPNIRSRLYQALETVYQTLLVLEIHLPVKITQPGLQFLIKPLDDILHAIPALFNDADPGQILKLNTQLNTLLTQVRQLRKTATADLSIPSATLYEHIQLNIFIETLQRLLKDMESWRLSLGISATT